MRQINLSSIFSFFTIPLALTICDRTSKLQRKEENRRITIHRSYNWIACLNNLSKVQSQLGNLPLEHVVFNPIKFYLSNRDYRENRASLHPIACITSINRTYRRRRGIVRLWIVARTQGTQEAAHHYQEDRVHSHFRTGTQLALVVPALLSRHTDVTGYTVE